MNYEHKILNDKLIGIRNQIVKCLSLLLTDDELKLIKIDVSLANASFLGPEQTTEELKEMIDNVYYKLIYCAYHLREKILHDTSDIPGHPMVGFALFAYY